jgi:pyruvate kinase
MVARHRLPMPILGLTYDPRVRRQMNLLYGVIPVRVEPLDNPAAMAAALDAVVLQRKLAVPGDLIVVVTSTKPTTPGATDTALVRRVGEPPVRG